MSDSLAMPDVHDAVRRRLAELDIRYTHGRKAAVMAMQRSSGPLSAAELHGQVEGVPLSSLYRTLTILDDSGVVQKHHDADGVARFELAEWLAGHHHHLVCRTCGAVEDVELGSDAEILLDDLAEALAVHAGFRPEGHLLEVVGVCEECQI